MKLNLCSGPSMWPGPDWVHVDRVDQSEYLRIMREDYNTPAMIASLPPDQRRLCEYLRGGGKVDFRVGDVREPLPFGNETADAIYIGQAVEHWNRQQETVRILAECHRVLKPGGAIRITTPDLDLIVDAYRFGQLHKFAPEQPAYYEAASPADQLSYILFGATGPECTTERFEGHFHCYTRGTIATALTEAGFSGPYEFGEKSAVFADAVDCGMSHSLGVEAVKR